MINILLLSDTHGYMDDRILYYAKQADQIWHAGDIGTMDVYNQLSSIRPLRGVYGNIDDAAIRLHCPLELFFEEEGISIYMIHIGGSPNKYPPKLKNKLAELRPKLFICGHSHILKVISDKQMNLLHLNPGAAGIYGFHETRTLLRFQLDKGTISNMEVIELGARASDRVL